MLLPKYRTHLWQKRANKIQVFVNDSNKWKLYSQSLKSRNAVTSVFRIFLSSHHMYKDIWIKICRTIIFPAFLCGCGTLSLLLRLCLFKVCWSSFWAGDAKGALRHSFPAYHFLYICMHVCMYVSCCVPEDSNL